MQLRAPPFWETKNLIALALWPVSLIYGAILRLRGVAYALHLLKSQEIPIPIIFVGNIRVGGTGKTPIVIALAKALHARGFRLELSPEDIWLKIRTQAPQEIPGRCYPVI